MRKPRRKWKNEIGDSHATHAKVEAQRAIAEELETHNALLKQIVDGFVLGDSLRKREELEAARRTNEINKASAERSNADEPETVIERERDLEAPALGHDSKETPRGRHARLFPGLPWNPPNLT